jgi:GDP-L-fucose synthase
MQKGSKIFVAGHRGLVGSAIARQLRNDGYTNLLIRTRSELDLLNQQKVLEFFENEKPEYVFFAAAKVGGIMAHVESPAEFGYENIAMHNNVIHSSYLNGVKKMVFLGSNCIYPRITPQPIKEEYLMTGALEETNEPYAIAKIAGIMLCRSYNKQYGTNYVSGMPANLYGPNDNFNLNTSHVFPALIRKFHEAKMRNDASITLWGTGKAMREFLHVDDMARACIYIMLNHNGNDLVNIGSGTDVTIKELAETMKRAIGFKGEILWDSSKPDGTPRKLLDISRLKSLGFEPSVGLEDGIRSTYEWYLESLKNNPDLRN